MSNENGSLYGDWFNENWHVWKEADGGIYAEMPAANLEIFEDVKYGADYFGWRAYSVSIHSQAFYGKIRTVHRKEPLAISIIAYADVEKAKAEAVFWYVYGAIEVPSGVKITKGYYDKMDGKIPSLETWKSLMSGATARMIYDRNAVEPIPADEAE